MIFTNNETQHINSPGRSRAIARSLVVSQNVFMSMYRDRSTLLLLSDVDHQCVNVVSLMLLLADLGRMSTARELNDDRYNAEDYRSAYGNNDAL